MVLIVNVQEMRTDVLTQKVSSLVASTTLSACPAFREEAVRPASPSGLLEKLEGIHETSGRADGDV